MEGGGLWQLHEEFKKYVFVMKAQSSFKLIRLSELELSIEDTIFFVVAQGLNEEHTMLYTKIELKKKGK